MNESIQSIKRFLLIATIFIVPLFFLPYSAEYFITQKGYFIFFTTLTLLLISGIQLLITKKITIQKTPFDKAVILFFLAFLLSTLITSTNKIQSLLIIPTGLGIVLSMSLLYILITSSFSKKSYQPFSILLTSGIVASIVSILFYFNPLENAQLSITLSFLKSVNFNVIGNQIEAGLFFGLVVVTSISMVISSLKKGKKDSLALPGISFVLSAVALGLISVTLFKNPPQLPPVGMSWSAAIETLKNPLTAFFGVGLDNYDALFTSIKTVSYNLTNTWQLNFVQSRSDILDVWTKTGLIGLVSMVLLAIYTIREIHGLAVNKDKNSLSYIVAGIYFALVFIFMPASFIMLFSFIIFIAQLTISGRTYEQTNTKEFDASSFPILYIGIAMVILLGSGYGLFMGQKAYAAEYHFKNSIDALRENKAQIVYEELTRAIQINPYVERYHAQFSQINLLLANNIAQAENLTDDQRKQIAQLIQQAISEAKILPQLNDKKATYWNNLAVVYRNVMSVAQGADAWSIAAYRQAILRDPNNPQLFVSLGGVYYSLEQYDQAIIQFTSAAQRKPNYANAYYNLAWALFQNKQYSESVQAMQTVVALVDPSDSESLKTAKENLEAFTKEAEAQQASQSAVKELPEGVEPSKDQQPLTIPSPATQEIDPLLDLKNAGPEDIIDEKATDSSKTSEETPEAPSPTQAN